MNGSWFVRGRSSRLALYGGSLIILMIIVYLYRAASIEMTRLYELNAQCSHQQEALSAQLHVIYEYKIRLEKSLQDEKNSIQALKQELNQRALREQTLRDKDRDNVELLKRFNAMQQKYNTLLSENKDLRDECTKKQEESLREIDKLESTLKVLRINVSKAQEDKQKALENFKNKYIAIQTNYTKLESEYNYLMKNSGSAKSSMLHLEKEIFQLRRELEQAKKTCVSPNFNQLNPQVIQNPEKIVENKTKINEKVVYPSNQSQQNISMKSVPVVNMDNTTKSSIKTSLTDIGKAKVKLPLGVVPIPRIIDLKIESEKKKKKKKKKEEMERIQKVQNALFKNDGSEIGSREKAVDIVNSDLQAQRPIANKHGTLNRQPNAGWLRVQPGAQEIGDEPNHLERLHGLEDVGPDLGDDQYDNDEFNREQYPKDNDLRIEREDEGEEEDDQLDYPNDLKNGKHNQ